MSDGELNELFELSNLSIEYGLSAIDFDKLTRCAIEYSRVNNLDLDNHTIIEIIKEAIIKNGKTSKNKEEYDIRTIKLANELYDELRISKDDIDNDEELLLEIKRSIHPYHEISNFDEIIKEAADTVLTRKQKRYLKK